MTTCKSPSRKKRASTCSSMPSKADSTRGQSERTRSSCSPVVEAAGRRTGVGSADEECAFATRWPERPFFGAVGSLKVERTWSKPFRTDPI